MNEKTMSGAAIAREFILGPFRRHPSKVLVMMVLAFMASIIIVNISLHKEKKRALEAQQKVLQK